ncbi:hypothetical protein KC360_g6709 [Hortaea werneckii]|nr:hypothetical protein KC325_g5084 [Hortaea werneckii]KAI6994950.1 hypothetical protein KC359_g4351 [Hortaea werneckii]KAI7143058.1 hypothetical protein KC344_g6654 [Hortaea werneckii]KAI7170568.1 hypothetical protein KC360_g6709 [Hortaea werneckii]
MSGTDCTAAPRVPAKSKERARKAQQMRSVPFTPDATSEIPPLVSKGSQVFVQNILETHANDPKPPLPLRSPLRESRKGLDLELLASALPGFYDVSRAGTNLSRDSPEEAPPAWPQEPCELSVDEDWPLKPLEASGEDSRSVVAHPTGPVSPPGPEEGYCAQQKSLPEDEHTRLAHYSNCAYDGRERDGGDSKDDDSEDESAIDLLKPRERAARRPKAIRDDQFFRGWNRWWEMNLYERRKEHDNISEELLRFTWPVVKQDGGPPKRPNEPGSPRGTAKKRPGPWTIDLRRLEYMDLM